MKKDVTLAELNAAVVLLTGIPAENIVELHVSLGVLTVITITEELGFVTHRVVIRGTAPVEGTDEGDGS